MTECSPCCGRWLPVFTGPPPHRLRLCLRRVVARRLSPSSTSLPPTLPSPTRPRPAPPGAIDEGAGPGSHLSACANPLRWNTGEMAAAALRSVRLTRFKSLRDQVLQLEPVTLLVGRNGSGKSNVIDALSLFALLADDRDVGDLERGDQEVAGLRGGLSGASPFGDPVVKVGCSVRTASGGSLSLDLVLDASERPEVISEKLVLDERGRSKKVLIEAKRKAVGSGISEAQIYSGGAPRGYQLLASRLAVVQAVTKIPGDTKARRLVIDSCAELTAALQAVFILDPVPAQMRTYARIGSAPDRSGSTLSALVYRLREEPDAWERLTTLVRGLVESPVLDVTFSEGRIPGEEQFVDVMVAFTETAPKGKFTVPARLMSDGTLRYLAIVASLLDLGEPKRAQRPAGRTLVVEEIENGLFPSQAQIVLDLLRQEAKARSTHLIATTHSPALLDALRPEDHKGVVICDREGGEGYSRLRRLTEHPDYIEIAGAGRVGQAATAGSLSEERPPAKRASELFAS